MKFVVTTWRQWLLLMALSLLATLLFPQLSTWAAPRMAPLNQTVPPPTPTKVVAATNVSNDDDDDDPPTATPTPLPPALSATVNVPRLNMRDGPGTSYPAVGVVTSGETLRVLGRNEIGDWWRVCCLRNTTTAGWVSAQFLQPDFDLAQANTLLPIVSGVPTPPPPTPVPTFDPAATPPPVVTGLQLQISQEPLYTWQGQSVVLVYLIINGSETAVTNLELRNELPPQFTFIGIDEAGGGVVTTENLETGPATFTIQWPELAVADRLVVKMRMQVGQDLPDGAVVDNLAVITAQDVAAITAGISIGMPPTTLPEFR